MSPLRPKNFVQRSISNVNIDLDSVTSGSLRKKSELKSFLHLDVLSENMVARRENEYDEDKRVDTQRNFHSPSTSSVMGKSHRKTKKNMNDANYKMGERATPYSCPINLNIDDYGSCTYNQVQGDLKPCRPSFSSQIALIGLTAQRITDDIKQIDQKTNSQLKITIYTSKRENSDLLFSMPTKCFIIGFTRCKYPAPVSFYKDRCEFAFYHPHESSEIQMIIWYRDMISFSYSNCKLSFKLRKSLVHFPQEYNPTNPLHSVVIELISKDALLKVRKFFRYGTKY